MKSLSAYLLCICIFLSSLCYSQNDETAKKYAPKVGIKTGLSFSNYKIAYTDPATTATTKIKTGSIIGGIADFPLSSKITLRTGLELIRKGALQKSSSANYTYTERNAYTSLDFPINIIFIDNNKAGFFAGGGLTLGTTFNAYYFRIYSTPFDYGINGQTGYQFPSGLLFTLNFCQGLKNVSADKSIVKELKNNYFGISAGYMF